MLNSHSYFRKRHGVPVLKLNEELNKMAQAFAKSLSSSGQSFSKDIYNEEPLGINVLISDKDLKPEKICNEWYNESKKYDYTNYYKFQKGTGHFTQMIWKNTEEIGIGFEKNDDKMYVVAYYYPAGNIFNEFESNVFGENKKT